MHRWLYPLSEYIEPYAWVETTNRFVGILHFVTAPFESSHLERVCLDVTVCDDGLLSASPAD